MIKNDGLLQEFIEAVAGEDDDGGGGGRTFPKHPSPILHVLRDNISRQDNPSVRPGDLILIVTTCLAFVVLFFRTFSPVRQVS